MGMKERTLQTGYKFTFPIAANDDRNKLIF